MPDQFREITTKGWGSRISDSVKGVLFGFIFFYRVLWSSFLE